MTFFKEVNRDALTVSPNRAATGPRTGFLKGFENSWNAQVRGAALFGIQEAMRNREDTQRRAMYDAGIENIPALSQQADDPFRMFTDIGDDYISAARYFESDVPENVRDETLDPKMAQRLRDFDKRILELRKQFPDLALETSSELWGNVKKEAQTYERRTATQRSDLGGAVGGFIGGALGALNPNTDPLNVATLPIGGAGKSVVTRVAGQAGAQGVIEAVNQFTGVQEQRQLLGLESGLGDAIMRVGGAAIGGAAVQGVGEAVGFGVRRLFRAGDAPAAVPVPQKPTLPPAATPEGVVPAKLDEQAAVLVERPQAYYDFMNLVSPYRATRLGKTRMVDDVMHVESQLEAWTGPQPWEVPPKMNTARGVDLNDFTRMSDLTALAEKASVDAIARRVDPQTMGRYDTLASEKKAAQLQLVAASKDRDTSLELQKANGLASASDEIARLDAKIARASAKNRKRLNTERAALVAQRDEALAKMSTDDTPTMAVIRKRVLEADEKMRDMAELVSRAYARARGKWAANEGDREAVLAMIRDSRSDIGPDTNAEAFVDNVQQSLVDKVPMLAERLPDGAVKANADAADKVSAVLAQRAEKLDEATETWRSEAAKIVKDAEKHNELDAAGKRAATQKAKEDGALPPGKYKVEGFDEPLDIEDRIIVVDDVTGDERSVTIREMLTEQVEREEDLKAVQSCSIR